jgi:hypothetical protein
MHNQKRNESEQREPEGCASIGGDQQQNEGRRHGPEFAERCAYRESRIVDGLNSEVGPFVEPQLPWQFERMGKRQRDANGYEHNGQDLQDMEHGAPPFLQSIRCFGLFAQTGPAHRLDGAPLMNVLVSHIK